MKRGIGKLRSGFLFLTLFVWTALGVFAATQDLYYVKGHAITVLPQYGMTVTLQNGSDSYRVQVPASDGVGVTEQAFCLSGIPAGTYDLTVEKEGHLPASVCDVVVNGSLTLDAANTVTLYGGDLNQDGTIDAPDLARLCSDFGKDPSDAQYPLSDLSGDGYRDAVDVTLFSLSFMRASAGRSYVTVAPDDTLNLSFSDASCVGDEMPVIHAAAGDEIRLPACSYHREGALFGGWSDGDAVYGARSLYRMPTDNIILSAVWDQSSSFMMLDSCDDKTGWWGVVSGNDSLTVDLRQKTEGIASIGTYSDIIDTVNTVWCAVYCNVWNSEKDVSAFENGSVALDVYIPDLSRIRLGAGLSSFELYDRDPVSGASDVCLAWDLGNYPWQEGWNEIRIPVSQASIRRGDPSRVISFRFFCYTTEYTTFYLDNIRMIDDHPLTELVYESGLSDEAPICVTTLPGETTELEQSLFWTNGRTMCGWSDGETDYALGDAFDVPEEKTVHLTALWQNEPSYDVYFNLTGGVGTPPDKVTDFAWESFYLPDAVYERNGYRFIGWSDGERTYGPGTIYTIRPKSVRLKAVWEALEEKEGLIASWPLDTGGHAGSEQVNAVTGKTDGRLHDVIWLPGETFGMNADFSCEGSYFAAPLPDTADLTSDFAASVWVKAPRRDAITEKRTVLSFGHLDTDTRYTEDNVFDTSERTRDYAIAATSGRAMYADPTAPNGETVIAVNAPIMNEVDALEISRHFGPVDLSAFAEDGVFHLWVFVEDASGILNSQIELTSAGFGDTAETSWDVGAELKSGWNELRLPLKNAASVAGGCDFSCVNFFRIYFNFYGDRVTEETVGIVNRLSMCRVIPADSAALCLSLDANGRLLLSGQMTEGETEGELALNDGCWHSILVSRDGDRITVYADGKEDVTASCVPFDLTGTDEIILAADPEGRCGLAGSAARLCLYDRSRQPADLDPVTVAESDNTVNNTVCTVKKGVEGLPRPSLNVSSTAREVFCGFENYQGFYDNDIDVALRCGFDHISVGYLTVYENMIDETGSMIKKNFLYVERDIDRAVEKGMRVVFRIHPFPELKYDYLGDLEKFDDLVKWYGELGAWISARWSPEDVAFQLMAEPHSNPDTVSWSYMTDRMIGAVRNAAPDLTILACSDAAGNIEQVKKMIPVTDDNVIYTFTTYEPYTVGWSTSYTGCSGYRSVYSYLGDLPYPVEEGVDYTEAIEKAIEGEPEDLKEEARQLLRDYIVCLTGCAQNVDYGHPYNYDWHLARAKALNEWSEQNGGGIHLYVSEFGVWDRYRGEIYGAPAGTGLSDETRLALIRDLRASMEAYEIGWNYWSYIESMTIFDPYATAYVLPKANITPELADQYVDRAVLDALGLSYDRDTQ